MLTIEIKTPQMPEAALWDRAKADEDAQAVALYVAEHPEGDWVDAGIDDAHGLPATCLRRGGGRAIVTAERESSPGIGGRCKDCKHWTPFDPKGRGESWRPAVVNKLGLCGQVKRAEEYEGEHWHEDEAENHPVVETLALVEDLSGCCALRTAAEFGCVLWELR